MKVTAIKRFRHKHDKGEIINRGDSIEVDEGYGQDLIQTQLAVKDTKSLKDHQNKMLQAFEQDKQSVHVETAEQRTTGMIGPAHDSEKPDERTMGKFQAKKSDAAAESTWSPIPDQGPKPMPEAVQKPAAPKGHQLPIAAAKPIAPDIKRS